MRGDFSRKVFEIYFYRECGSFIPQIDQIKNRMISGRGLLNLVLFPWTMKKVETQRTLFESVQSNSEYNAKLNREDQAALNFRVYTGLKQAFLRGEISAIGIDKAGYSEMKEAYKTSRTLIKYPFPIIPITTYDDGIRLEAEWGYGMEEEEDRATVAVLLYGVTGKFLHILPGPRTPVTTENKDLQ